VYSRDQATSRLITFGDLSFNIHLFGLHDSCRLRIRGHQNIFISVDLFNVENLDYSVFFSASVIFFIAVIYVNVR
jgi:hypothetical protein